METSQSKGWPGLSQSVYASDNGWFFHEESKLGSMAAGKLGDAAVSSDDYFDRKGVSDEGIKQLKSMLTVVGGRILYSDLH
jgi:predicted amidohydrolase YtcJ